MRARMRPAGTASRQGIPAGNAASACLRSAPQGSSPPGMLCSSGSGSRSGSLLAAAARPISPWTVE